MDPIYPDKSKTGLAALKPLTDVFFAEPERWNWEMKLASGEWVRRSNLAAFDLLMEKPERAHECRLTPKPRRVWIGAQSYPEPVALDTVHDKYICDPLQGAVRMAEGYTSDVIVLAARNGYLFGSQEDAIQCLEAHRRARRVE